MSVWIWLHPANWSEGRFYHIKRFWPHLVLSLTGLGLYPCRVRFPVISLWPVIQTTFVSHIAELYTYIPFRWVDETMKKPSLSEYIVIGWKTITELKSCKGLHYLQLFRLESQWRWMRIFSIQNYFIFSFTSLWHVYWENKTQYTNKTENKMRQNSVQGSNCSSLVFSQTSMSGENWGGFRVFVGVEGSAHWKSMEAVHWTFSSLGLIYLLNPNTCKG